MNIKKFMQLVGIVFCVTHTMRAMEEKLTYETKKWEEAARRSGDAVAMFQLGEFYANKELDYKVAVGWLLAYGIRSIQDTLLLSGNGFKKLNHLQNEIEKLASKSSSLKNYYIENEREYAPEFELHLNEIRILTKENKLENPDWIHRVLGKDELVNFIEPSLWQEKRTVALETVHQMLLPGLVKKD